jgi:predicted nuclease with RNAse H fold
VLLIGLDAASDWRNFGFAVGRYTAGGPVTIEAAGVLGSGDKRSRLETTLGPWLGGASPALIAVDAPLGWPVGHAAALKDHVAGAALSGPKDALFRRRTDEAVRQRTRKRPLEVGADRIARAAFSALEALELLRTLTRQPIPLAWGEVPETGIAAIEVYPAATLTVRGCLEPGYKAAENVAARLRIAAALSAEIVGLSQRVTESDDVFDAYLCTVAARDYLDGAAVAPGVDETELAKSEGWIWVRRSCTDRIAAEGQ